MVDLGEVSHDAVRGLRMAAATCRCTGEGNAREATNVLGKPPAGFETSKHCRTVFLREFSNAWMDVRREAICQQGYVPLIVPAAVGISTVSGLQ
jgi:hypothetical protein